MDDTSKTVESIPKVGVLQRVFTVTSKPRAISVMDTFFGLVQVGVSSGVIYIILGQLSSWAHSSLQPGTAAIVAAMVIAIKTGLTTYFSGQEPTTTVVTVPTDVAGLVVPPPVVPDYHGVEAPPKS